MVGRKLNLKFLISKLREVGVTIVKTTEFVQGQTSRWGLAWSFVPPARKIVSPHVAEKKNLSFMLEVLLIFPLFPAKFILSTSTNFLFSSFISLKLFICKLRNHIVHDRSCILALAPCSN